MAQERISVPNIGDSKDVDVVEVLVKVGDRVEREQTLIVLEREKASMDVPAPRAGVVKELLIKTGDKASEGTPILVLESEGDSDQPDAKKKSGAKKEETKKQAEPAKAKSSEGAKPKQPAAAPKQANRGGEQKKSGSTQKTPAAKPAKAQEKKKGGAAAQVNVPNIGDSKDVDVVEVLVKVGDRIEAEQTLIVLESEKASMDVPA